MPSASLRLAVVGAGAAGLAAARELRREGHAPVVFERAAAVGGPGSTRPRRRRTDPLGAAATHSSLYASLRTNLPREVMGFLDFPFVASAATSSADPRRFPGHEEVLRYLEAFARRFDLLSLIRFETEVLRIRREPGVGWAVASKKLGEKGSGEEEVYDAVVVCNGHYTEPRVATIPGVDAWPGKQMHSHNYREPEPFLDQIVIIIGASASAVDISRDIASVAKEVHIADRSAPASTNQKQPGYNLWLHSMLQIDRTQEDGSVVFRDGSSVKADVIMHCTGYLYDFPFLGDDSTITVDDNRVDPLYKHVFPAEVAPQLSFIGLPWKFEYDDWLAEQCSYPPIEEWRKLMYAASTKNKAARPESYRDEWDDDHLVVEASEDFKKYL
ncbi:hypothetical protein PR202_gb07399 [Eleusine coracana subsp. coracana]|uniref:Flavin-containing monooxygenase n=1 Tax=Eleusine coracana subsp. coracana TaxID=191504 RepID=A0AAV5EBB4_ELECO|nr:hypothetical protein PR202_gb07399 [Eleusine coracana subsp. coracana]